MPWSGDIAEGVAYARDGSYEGRTVVRRVLKIGNEHETRGFGFQGRTDRTGPTTIFVLYSEGYRTRRCTLRTFRDWAMRVVVDPTIPEWEGWEEDREGVGVDRREDVEV